MNTRAKLGDALFSSLIKLREQKGIFDMADVGALFEQISQTLHPPDSGLDHGLKEEIQQLSLFIAQAKSDINSIGASGHSKNATNDAALHLDAVIKGTEEASHAIMDAADTIRDAANTIGGKSQETILHAVTKIYEACNFQDVAGQRVNKVIRILGEIDARIENVFRLADAPAAQPVLCGGKDGEEILLNGPQLPDQAPSQADIDALFGTL